MTIFLAILSVVVLVLGVVVGYLRDLQRALATLAGIFLGASVVNFWAGAWGQALAQRLGSESERSWVLAVSIVLLLVSVVVAGYGGGGLLGPAKRETLLFRRAEAALLGLLNGTLLMGYIVRFVADSDKARRAAILDAAITRTLYNGLPVLALVIAATVAALVVVNAIIGLTRRSTTPATLTGAAGSAAAPPLNIEQKQRLSSIADKIDDRLS